MGDFEDEKAFRERMNKAQDRYRLPEGARQILLVRHGSSVGETADTIEFGELTISDPVLAPDGHTQAEQLGRHLADEAISAIFVTPLRRTRQTAAPLAARKGLEPIEIADLREVHLGDWEHTFYEHARAGHPLLKRMFEEESWDVLPGAEPMTVFAERVRRGLEAVVEATPVNSTAVVFSHAGTIAELCRQATGSRAFAFNGPENTSVSRLVISGSNAWKLRSFNDVAHLGYL